MEGRNVHGMDKEEEKDSVEMQCTGNIPDTENAPSSSKNEGGKTNQETGEDDCGDGEVETKGEGGGSVKECGGCV